MSSKKRALKEITGLNEDGNSGDLQKKIKLETFKEVNEQPVFDEEYFRKNPPKLESFDSSSSMKRPLAGSTGLNEDGSMGNLTKRIKVAPGEANENESMEPMKTEVGQKDSSKSLLRLKCDICSELECSKAMKRVGLEEERMVLAWMFPEYFVEVDKRIRFFEKKNGRVCYSHVLEANDKIGKFLDNTDSIQKLLMPNFKSARSQISLPGMKCLLSKFLTRNKQKRKKQSIRKERHARCQVCNRQQTLDKLSCATLKTLKTALMIGCVLRGTHSIEDAKLFIASGKLDRLCTSHFKKSIQQILEILRVEEHSKISDASPDSMKNLMKTVNCLDEEMTEPKFKECVQELIKRVEPQKGAPISAKRNSRCAVCECSTKDAEICQLSSKHVKTALMVRCILKGTHTIEDAQQMIMSDKMKRICHEHFTKGIKTILKFLGIQNAQDIHDCSETSMTKLMETVNALLPNITIRQFKDAVIDLAKKVDKFKEQEAMMKQSTDAATDPAEECESVQEEEETSTCGVCQLQHPKDKFITIKSKSSKMLIMIGCVLRETHNMEEAESFISSGKEEYSCRKHFRKAMKKILNVLEIKDVSAISNCSDSSMKKLMTTVNSLLPDMTISEFESALARMTKKIEKFEVKRKLITDQ